MPASIKPSVTISGGQILVAKSGSTAAKAVGAKQMVAQGVAKAVVSSGSSNVLTQSSQNLTKAQVTSAVSAKTGTQGPGIVKIFCSSMLIRVNYFNFL